MFKGLIALFTSGIIFNPMVLFGVISGAYTILHLEPEAIRTLFLDYHFYLLVAFVSAVYTFLFARLYKEGGESIDWFSTGLRVIWNVLRYFISFILAMSFITMISIF